MKKDFDGWNTEKKYIDDAAIGEFYHQRDIWWCILGANVGFEQDGKGKTFERPVLVLRGLSVRTCIVVPLSTSIYKSDYRVNVGLITGKENQVIISQIRVVDTKRFTEKIAMLDKPTFEIIRKTVRDMF